MRPLTRKELALSLVIVLAWAGYIWAWNNVGSIQWIPDCGRLCFVSRVYSDICGPPCSVLFAGANFTLVLEFFLPDAGVELCFDVEYSGWTAHNVRIWVGGWPSLSIFAPLRTSTVEHDGRLFGLATADSPSLWGKLVFLVSV